MKETKEILNELLNFDKIIEIINLLGITQNIKHIYIKNIEFNDKLYSIKKDEIASEITHEEKIEMTINCNDNRALKISFYTDYYREHGEYDGEDTTIKVSYRLLNSDIITIQAKIKNLYNFSEYINSETDLIHSALNNINYEELLQKDSNLHIRYYKHDEKNGFIPLSFNLIPTELETLKQQIGNSYEKEKKYNFIENIEMEKEKIKTLINDKNYNFNQITISFLNEIRNKLLDEMKKKFESELEISEVETQKLNKLSTIQKTVKNELKKSKFNEDELLILRDYFQDTSERIEKRQANKRTKTFTK